MKRRRWVGLALVSASLGAVPAQAGSDINRFRPPMTLDGTMGLDASEGLFPWQLSLGGYLTYTDRPLVWRYSDDTYEPIIGQQLTLDLVAAIGAMRMVDVAVALPIIMMQKGPNSASFDGQSLAGAGVGDLRVVPRVTLVRERSRGFGLAVIPELTFPTGSADRFLGDPRVAFRPRVVGTLPLHHIFPARIYASLGYNWRRNETVGDEPTLGDELTIGDEWLYGLGTQVDFYRYGVPVVGVVEINGATGATTPFAGNGLSAAEVVVGARTRIWSDWVATLGVGGGISRGVGASAWRLILGVAWAPLPPDRDGDGIPDVVDACPDEPEDYDQFEDEDGCPDVGPKDQDGDGIPDDDDRCPAEPEDVDEFEDFDGCPDDDHDHDGVPNDSDECPDQKETINGIEDGDGCPDEGEGVTQYIEDVRIEIKQTILFETAKAAIKDESKAILNQVALQILAHPEIGKIRVEGHTDSRGNDEDNLYLSQDRADSVRRYLVGKGVAKDKLEAVGYGETRPIDTNDTAAGRSRNRRVDFVIVGAK